MLNIIYTWIIEAGGAKKGGKKKGGSMQTVSSQFRVRIMGKLKFMTEIKMLVNAFN